ncbi:hypothetical protein [Desulfosporosinus acididurans]|uniref:hypothetical protein n=1 Tax=Desulfosporosinus acididurans TaxID=476652 RepID=UPI001910751B|nr:hypothetical protein [Desulfosporosinus acididurans]
MSIKDSQFCPMNPIFLASALAGGGLFSIFNNLKECGLEHCFVHGGKAVEAVLHLIFIASNIMQLFLVRRLRNYFTTQREMVRLLLKGLYLLKYRTELVFSSS